MLDGDRGGGQSMVKSVCMRWQVAARVVVCLHECLIKVYTCV